MKQFILGLTLVTAITFTSCADDDTAPIIINNGGGDTGSTTGEDLPTGEVTSDLTLDATVEYNLTGSLVMASGTTLTIPAGTKILAKAGGSQIYIAIGQGAKINAEGTPSQPIVITSSANTPAKGDWGGVLLLGYGKTNKGASATSEVGNLTYGGDDNTDNSGVIKYMRLEYTGAKINSDSEFNGFSFYAVGSGTIIENIQVHKGNDDGVEFFGGAVECTNVIVSNSSDDSVDWTEGWEGAITNAYILQDDDSDKAIEADSNSSDNLATPISNPTLTNFTIMGIGSANGKEAIRLRRGTKGILTNFYIKGYGEGFDIDNEATVDHVFDGTLNVTDVTFDDVETKLKSDNNTEGNPATEAEFIVSGEGNATMTDVATWGANWSVGI